MGKFKFSIVMAAYNVEEFIGEAIDSLINQTIGFNNIQLIIVNDGSSDNTDEICQGYASKYKNINYIKQRNQGVAVARNEGLKRVSGRYVNFLDSDDYLSPETLKNVFNFFSANHDKIDIVGIPIYFFEAKDGEHLLNRKFSETKIIDLSTDFNFPQLSSSSSFIKASSAMKCRFQKGLKYGEDAKYVSEIMMNKMRYGLVKEAKYMYRKRSGDNQSALQKTFVSSEWYLPTLEKFHFGIINDCIKKFGKIPKYFQNLLMYDLQWRVNQKEINDGVLTSDEIKEYRKKIIEILSYINDSVILQQKEINHRTKMHVIKLKHQIDKFSYKMVNNKTEVYIKNTKLYSISSTGITIDIAKVDDNFLYLEGFYNIFHRDDLAKIKVILENENNVFYAETFLRKEKEIKLLNDVINLAIGIKFKIPLEKATDLGASIWINGCTSRVGITFGKFSRINNMLKNKKTYKFTYNKTTAKLNVDELSFTKKIKYKYNFFKKLIKEKEYSVIIFRVLAFINYVRLFRKNIWIISDRYDVADDSGEHLFKYLRKNYRYKYNLIYVLEKGSVDYKRMKKYGKVLDPNSMKFKMLFLYSKSVISSHAEDRITNPFGKRKEKYLDLYQFKFTFLQHGIIKDDLSEWLNKYNKNLDIFITSAIAEYNSILDGNYYYKKDVVKLTGLPRYDGLNNDNVIRQILIMPTWRANLASKIDKNGRREYNNEFKESDFFKFYNELLNNEFLINKLRDTNCHILLAPHPNLRVQLCDFTSNELVKIANENQKYQDMFNKSALLVTDYSSVAFDFAYLKKPVIYSQFDKETFFNSHSYNKGYFEYERDGFGDVTETIDQTVNKIINVINNEFKIEKKYFNRIEKFFLYTDKNNSERVYKEISNLK